MKINISQTGNTLNMSCQRDSALDYSQSPIKGKNYKIRHAKVIYSCLNVGMVTINKYSKLERNLPNGCCDIKHSFTSTFTLTEQTKFNKGPKFQNKACKSYILLHIGTDGYQ